MAQILARIGVVAWWFGAAWGLAWGLGAVASIFNKEAFDRLELVGMMVAYGLALTVPLWAISYVLTGSFWKPRKPIK